MSAHDRDNRVRARSRVRDLHELDRCLIEPDAPLGLTDEGRRALAALKALNLLPTDTDRQRGSDPPG
jgi:hypothetical protein